MLLNNSGIYSIRNIINGKIYIGSAVNFRARWSTHKLQLKQNYHHSAHLQRAYNKYGADIFEYSIISYVQDKSKLIENEQKWLDFFKPEYNISKIAGSTLGTKRTKEQKAKMSKPRSKEAIDNMRILREQFMSTDEYKQVRLNMSNAQKKYFANNVSARKGTKCTDEQRLNMSNAQKNIQASVLGKNPNAMKVIYDNVTYSCKKELYNTLFTGLCSYSNFNVRIKDGRISVIEDKNAPESE